MNELPAFADYERLAYKLSRDLKASNPGLLNMDFEDVFQEVSMAFVNAIGGFDPSRNIQFSTYFVKAATNRLKLISKRRSRAVREVSYDAPVAGSEGDAALRDVLFDPDAPLPDADITKAHHKKWIERRMSLRSRVVVKLINEPPEWLIEGASQVDARNAMAREQGFNAHVRRQKIDLDFVLSFLGWKSSKRFIQYELKRLVRLASD